jgi:hypothetical protein
LRHIKTAIKHCLSLIYIMIIWYGCWFIWQCHLLLQFFLGSFTIYPFTVEYISEKFIFDYFNFKNILSPPLASFETQFVKNLSLSHTSY